MPAHVIQNIQAAAAAGNAVWQHCQYACATYNTCGCMAALPPCCAASKPQQFAVTPLFELQKILTEILFVTEIEFQLSVENF
jgi:hypothetical protein